MRNGGKNTVGYCLLGGVGPAGSAGKESACSVGDLGSVPGLGRQSKLWFLQ